MEYFAVCRTLEDCVQLLLRLAGLLEVQSVSSRRRYKATRVEQLCVVLRRLSSPARWRDLEIPFGTGHSFLCELFYETIEQLDVRWSGLLCLRLGDLMEDRAVMYAQRVLKKGAALDNCVAFIDGTGLFVARLGGALQRSVYGGHPRTDMPKFQTVTKPDGLIFHFHWPVEGRRHDTTMYHEAGKDGMLQTRLHVGGMISRLSTS